jgi:hypothetical protein
VAVIIAGSHVPVILFSEVPGRISGTTPIQYGPSCWNVGITLSSIVITVEQLERLPQSSMTVHNIVEIPTLNIPLASFPVPLRFVDPDISNVIFTDSSQLSVANKAGIVYELL